MEVNFFPKTGFQIHDRNLRTPYFTNPLSHTHSLSPQKKQNPVSRVNNIIPTLYESRFGRKSLEIKPIHLGKMNIEESKRNPASNTIYPKSNFHYRTFSSSFHGATTPTPNSFVHPFKQEGPGNPRKMELLSRYSKYKSGKPAPYFEFSPTPTRTEGKTRKLNLLCRGFFRNRTCSTSINESATKQTLCNKSNV